MKRLLTRIISCFIPDKEKRRNFRLKHDYVVRLSTEIDNLQQKLKMVNRQILELRYDKSILNELDQISVQIPTFLGVPEALGRGFIKDETEHLQNVEKLKENLDKDAQGHLEVILNRLSKCTYPQRMLLTEVYSQDEINDWRAAKNIVFEIKNIDNYYQYKNYKLPVNYFEPAIFIYKHGLDRLKTFKNIGDKVIIDVGAYILDSAIMLRSFTGNKIISFEPAKSTYELGLKTKELNNLENIVYENLALGDKNTTSCLYINDNCPLENRLTVPHDSKEETCQTVTLDSYVEKHNLKVGLIKVDIEGFEQNFLQGALNTIKEQKPILILSIYHNYNDFYKIKPYLESLNLGYKFDFFRGIDERYCCDIMLMAEVY